MIFCRYNQLSACYCGFVYENCFIYEEYPIDPYFSDYCAALRGKNGKVKEAFEFMYSGRFLHGESPDGKGMDKKCNSHMIFLRASMSSVENMRGW